MKININCRLTIGEIQERFSTLYPNLRLAFFRPVWNSSFLFLVNEIRSGECLGDYEKEPKTIEFIITPDDHITEVKRKFNDQYKLKTRVMWYAGNRWLIADPVINYTLSQQNAFAETNNVSPDENGFLQTV